jgi:hypothetical protein
MNNRARVAPPRFGGFSKFQGFGPFDYPVPELRRSLRFDRAIFLGSS